ncbi:hypothetical protein [Thermotalea metallivorans]|uniref:Uncharacterized protein n=1 Tax=Thermotalea metallivorans TaxID=520762 RepID=A0A140L8J5_9FIRM|nr:hypothetical protein [Thermotalea metallivorans]KXG76870.1 hypothetical protein AN619_08620 [Thermotalea metallivorans]
MIYGYFIVIGLVIFLCAYGLGRRIGIKEGFAKGIHYAPIAFREEAYKTNRCPVCNKFN